MITITDLPPARFKPGTVFAALGKHLWCSPMPEPPPPGIPPGPTAAACWFGENLRIRGACVEESRHSRQQMEIYDDTCWLTMPEFLERLRRIPNPELQAWAFGGNP